LSSFYPTSHPSSPQTHLFPRPCLSLTPVSVPLTLSSFRAPPVLSISVPCLTLSIFLFLSFSSLFFFDALHCKCACCTHTQYSQYLGITAGALSLRYPYTYDTTELSFCLALCVRVLYIFVGSNQLSSFENKGFSFCHASATTPRPLPFTESYDSASTQGKAWIGLVPGNWVRVSEIARQLF